VSRWERPFSLVLGYNAARVLRLGRRDCRTVAIEVGMQNGGMATGLAFDVLQGARAAMGSATFGPWSAITASVLASWWRREPTDNTSTLESETAREEG
jgi:BASS family bile acid:Na+ symporter